MGSIFSIFQWPVIYTGQKHSNATNPSLKSPCRKAQPQGRPKTIASSEPTRPDAQPQGRPKTIAPSAPTPLGVPTHNLPKRGIASETYHGRRVKDVYDAPYPTTHGAQYHGESPVEISVPFGAGADGTIVRAGEWPYTATKDIFDPFYLEHEHGYGYTKEGENSHEGVKRRSINDMPERTVSHVLEKASSDTIGTSALGNDGRQMDPFFDCLAAVLCALVVIVSAVMLFAFMRSLALRKWGNHKVEDDVERGRRQDPGDGRQ